MTVKPDRARWRSYIELISTLVMAMAAVVVAGAVVYQYWPKSRPPVELPPPKQPLSIAGAQTMGSHSAPLALIEYGDFQCPSCGKLARNVMPAIDAQFVKTGRLLRVYRYFPLGDIHPQAFPAAVAAACAGIQGRFWQMHDALYADQNALEADGLRRTSATLGLDETAFQGCLKNDANDVVQLDAGSGLAIGISATPTLLVGTLAGDTVKVLKRIDGAPPGDYLSRLITKLLGTVQHADH